MVSRKDLASERRSTFAPALGTVQRKLYVGAVDDPAEQEADDVADHVVDSLRDETRFAGTAGSSRVRRFGGGAPVVRRLVSGSELRDELGGPSSTSKSYRVLIKALDSYATLMRNPLTTSESQALAREAKNAAKMADAISGLCKLFLEGHEGDQRAGRVAQIKLDAERERAALRAKAEELKRGAAPTYTSWNEAIGANAAGRDITAERGQEGGRDGGMMNVVTGFKFGPLIGQRGPDTRAQGGFFKADKANVATTGNASIESVHAINLGIPLGPDFADHRAEVVQNDNYEGGTERDRAGPRFANRSVAAYRIDQLLNANVIAKAEFAVQQTPDGLVRGQLMEKAKGTKVTRDPQHLGLNKDDPVVQRLLSKLDLVDSLCGQIDRHGGNVFLDQDQQGGVTSITGIDNDLAFGTKNFVPGETGAETVEYAGIGRYIDEETGSAILGLKAKDLHAALDDLLLPDEVQATIDRLVATQRIIRAAQNEGRLIGPEGWGADTAVERGGPMYGIMQPSGYHSSIFKLNG